MVKFTLLLLFAWLAAIPAIQAQDDPCAAACTQITNDCLTCITKNAKTQFINGHIVAPETVTGVSAVAAAPQQLAPKSIPSYMLPSQLRSNDGQTQTKTQQLPAKKKQPSGFNIFQ